MVALAIPTKVVAPPEWLFIKGSADDTAITRDMVSISFWRNVELDAKKRMITDGLDHQQAIDQITAELQDSYVLQRRLAEAADNAYEQEDHVEKHMEQARVQLLAWMRENNLYHTLEFADVEDYLLSKVDPVSGDENGINYNVGFMINYLLPVLEANGYSRDTIVGLKANYSKARMLVGPLRRSLARIFTKAEEIRRKANAENDPDKKAELEKEFQTAIMVEDGPRDLLKAFMESLTEINPETGKPYTTRNYQDRLSEIERGIEHQHPTTKAKTDICFLSETESVFYIHCTDRIQHRAVEMALRALTDPSLSTVYELINNISHMITPQVTP